MTKAAEKMCITQPAMSFQIREMEKELQLKLFDRDHLGIHLTEAGKIMQSGFIYIMDNYHRVLDRALSSSYGKVRLTIGYHGFINWAGVHSFIAGFSARHPDIEVTIIQNHRNTVLAMACCKDYLTGDAYLLKKVSAFSASNDRCHGLIY